MSLHQPNHQPYYQRKVQVYETDLMGIVHHSNYLRFCEEARVSWCANNLSNLNSQPLNVSWLTVVETRVKYKSAYKFNEAIIIDVQVNVSGAIAIFQYQLKDENGKIKAVAETSHCAVNENLKPLRLPEGLIDAIKKSHERTPWTETWL